MKPFIVLIASFFIALLFTRLANGSFDFALAGSIAMAVMLLFTSIGHFTFVKGMAMMIPSFIPFKKEMVYATGLIEIAAAAGLLIDRFRQSTTIFLMIFFVLIMPVNIYAAVKKINFQEATTDGPGPAYLWFRIPLQLLFIFWVWYFGIKSQS